MAKDWDQADDEELPWPISESEEDSQTASRWGGVLAILVALGAAVAIIWGTIDYFVG